MQADNNLNFLRDKIYQLRSAIMYSMSNDLLKLPNTIVSAIKVDEMGQLWFVCNRPAGDLNQYEATFPVKLYFYRKGVNFHLEVNGKATIVKNADEGISVEESEADQYLLLKMVMSSVEYNEPHEKRKGKVEVILERGYKWIMRTVAVPHDNRPALFKLNSMKRAV